MFLDALAGGFDVFLLVVPVAGPADASQVPEFIARRTARVVVLALEGRIDPHYALIARLKDPEERLAALLAYPRPALERFATSDTVREAASHFAGVRFDLVHVMRLYLASFAGPYLSAAAFRPACAIDIDDDEGETRRRLAALHDLRGRARAAALAAAEARKYWDLERRWLPRFDRVAVCADGDRIALERRVGLTSVVVLPNAVDLPASPRGQPGGTALTLLFVGSLGYFPNEDAACFLCREVLPRLRAATDRPVSVRIVGPHPPASVRSLAGPDISVTGAVADVSPYYADAHLAVVPLRAGGGTRIKVLEAFAHGVPVVSTALGAEGLDVEQGSHLLIADTAEGLAAACLRLADNPAVADALARRARALVAARYGLPAVKAMILAALRSVTAPAA